MPRRWGWLSLVTLILMLAATGLTAWAIRGTVHSQEDRLLRERANEVGLVFREAITSLSSQLNTVGGVLRATHASPIAFKRASAALIAGSRGRDSIVLLRKTAAGYRADLANGPAFKPHEEFPASLVLTLDRAGTAAQMVPTQIMGAGADRTIGFALGPPAAPDGTVIYLQISLGTLGPPRAAGTSPFNELHVVLYDAVTPDPAEALVTTTNKIPLSGDVRVVPVDAGVATWTIQVSAVDPLVGSTTANAQWLALAAGTVLSILLTLVVEIETRRRRSALALYRSEHRIAEELQRSLLPVIPAIDDLDIAARYLPGSADQEVGGDWYDAFELEGGYLGLAVGDVLGHDIEAAVLMSRVQTALRAHAIVGEQPGEVLDRLEHLVASLHTDRLVTVFYAALGPPDDYGQRQLVYANAGHPPPLLHDASGAVVELDGASSLLLGVPTPDGEVRPQHTLTVQDGSTLLLFTDGLVEVPGESLTVLIGQLKRAMADSAPSTTPEQLCDRLLSTMRPVARSDDVALLVVRTAFGHAQERRHLAFSARTSIA